MDTTLFDAARSILIQGGFVMPPLILLSVMLFTSLSRLGLELIKVAQKGHPASTLLASPEKLEASSIDAIILERSQWHLHFNRRLKFARILTTAAPLLGLLGTVAGMLKTFSAMSIRKTDSIDSIASGISEALITTETGLAIAIAGLVFLWSLKGFRRRLSIRFEWREATYLLTQINSKPTC